MGALFGASVGFLVSGWIAFDVIGLALAAIGAALQVVYWILKIKGEKHEP